MNSKDYIMHQLLSLCDDPDTRRFACEEIRRMVSLINDKLTNK